MNNNGKKRKRTEKLKIKVGSINYVELIFELI